MANITNELAKGASPESVEGYDFYDFGCSTGANIKLTHTLFPTLRGLGIDIDPAKIAAARANGHEAIVYDILKLPDKKLASFVTMAHFLEHLPGVDDARRMIAKAISLSRNFVFIRQPWFDADGELMRHDLKFYWSHWHGHRNKMTTLDFHSILRAEQRKDRIAGFSMFGRSRVANSSNPTLLPLDAPIDQHQYQEALHGAKPTFKLPLVAFKEIVVKVDIGDATGADAMLAGLGQLEPIFESRREHINELPSP